MKNIANIFLISLLLLMSCVTCAEAKSKSFTIRVSCIVPARLEMSTPDDLNIALNDESSIYENSTLASSKIQTQETKFIDGKKTIFYTVVER
ncbi:MAG: hypothetical protein JW869_04370 [Candidatus Omnitrophica bacterium]|nr:hypothetical protein [Candidatus Omnitrophota bacterium]